MASPNRKKYMLVTRLKKLKQKTELEEETLRLETARKEKQDALELEAKTAEEELLKSLKVAVVNPEPLKKAGRPPKNGLKELKETAVSEENVPEVKVDEQA